MEGWIVFVILGAVALLVLLYFIARKFEQIASEKGFEGKSYFWWTFCLTIVGIPMVIALPDRKGMEKIIVAIKESTSKTEVTEIQEAAEELPEL